MEIDYQKEGEVVIITIHGDVDASSAIILDEQLKKCLDQNEQFIAVDCSELEYISSAGLGVFMSYINDFKATAAQMVLFGLSEKVFKVFELIGLNTLLNIQPSKELALQEFV